MLTFFQVTYNKIHSFINKWISGAQGPGSQTGLVTSENICNNDNFYY